MENLIRFFIISTQTQDALHKKMYLCMELIQIKTP